jgi:hypothetical protein
LKPSQNIEKVHICESLGLFTCFQCFQCIKRTVGGRGRGAFTYLAGFLPYL